METNELKEGLAISFWTSLAGVALAVIAAAAILLWYRSEFTAWLTATIVPIFICLEIGSVTAGLSELSYRSGKAALVISVTALVLAIGTIYFRPMRDIVRDGDMVPLFFATPITGIIAGAAAIDVKNRQTRALKPMLIIWLAAFVFTAWPLAQIVLGSRNPSFVKLFISLAALLFGPWMIRITGLLDFRYVADVHTVTLWLGFGLTIVLAAVSIITIKAKRPGRAAVLLVFFAGILLSWLVVGAIDLRFWWR
ncbi:MAG: hypothetical protein ACYS8Z_00065 [Planctomycetota bacterium]|jgi:hypothetical protein